MTKFEALTEAQRESVCAAVANALDDARDIPCSWCGASGDDACDYDFPHVRHDPDRVKEVAAAAINVLELHNTVISARPSTHEEATR